MRPSRRRTVRPRKWVSALPADARWEQQHREGETSANHTDIERNTVAHGGAARSSWPPRPLAQSRRRRRHRAIPAAETEVAEEPSSSFPSRRRTRSSSPSTTGAAGEELGYEIEFLGPATADTAGQITAIEQAIELDPVAITIAALDPDAVVPALQAAGTPGSWSRRTTPTPTPRPVTSTSIRPTRRRLPTPSSRR